MHGKYVNSDVCCHRLLPIFITMEIKNNVHKYTMKDIKQ